MKERKNILERKKDIWNKKWKRKKKCYLKKERWKKDYLKKEGKKEGREGL